MLKRLLWRWMMPYVAQAIHSSLVGFYTQLVAAGQLQNVPAPEPHEYPPGVRHSDLRH